MNKIVEVWDRGEKVGEGALVQIINSGPTNNCIGVVQDKEGWLRAWPLGAIKVVGG